MSDYNQDNEICKWILEKRRSLMMKQENNFIYIKGFSPNPRHRPILCGFEDREPLPKDKQLLICFL